ncbi:MAG TPA: lipopolysaccharide biosynthesis protein [Rubrivivax sp.]|nr:lipopolysaccharide biosynthesis protein [Rubrivivax sp.]
MVQQAMRPSGADLGKRVVYGVLWQYGLTAFRIVITLGSTAVLARMLHPQDYGLVAMAALVTELAGLMANTGFGSILTQRVRLTRLDLDTAFWASLGIGAALALVVAALAWPASRLFSQPELVTILCISGLNFIIHGMTVVPSAILNRLLKFQADAWIQVLQLVVRAAVAIALAWLGQGYWSLVFAGLVAALVGAVVELVVVGYRPRWRFNKTFVRNNLSASSSYLGSGLLGYGSGNFDVFIVGRWFGAEHLGYYQMAMTLPSELRNRLAAPLQRVLFPAYALLQDNPERLRSVAFRSQKILSVLVLPIAAFMVVAAEEIVAVLYGPKWEPAVPLLQVLAFGGALRALFGLVGNIFFAIGRPELVFKVQLLVLPAVVLGTWVGSHWGPIGVAWGMLAASSPGLYSAHLAWRAIGGSLTDFMRAITTAAVLSVVVALVCLGPHQVIAQAWGPFASLIVSVTLSVVACLAVLWLGDKPLLQPLLDRLKRVRSRS